MRLEGCWWDLSNVRIVLLSVLSVLYLASVHLADLMQTFACGLSSVFLWVVDVEIQFKLTIEVIA